VLFRDISIETSLEWLDAIVDAVQRLCSYWITGSEWKSSKRHGFNTRAGDHLYVLLEDLIKSISFDPITETAVNFYELEKWGQSLYNWSIQPDERISSESALNTPQILDRENFDPPTS
jgi:hypothetical protein